MSVLVGGIGNTEGLCFVAHGLGAFKEQKQVEVFSSTFEEKGFVTVRYDARNTIGESDGEMFLASATSYKEDLEDVIKWASIQSWYQEPFWLVGHSLGGLVILEYALDNPEYVKAIAPFSTVVSGTLTTSTTDHLRIAQLWEEAGYLEQVSNSRPGAVKKISWAYIQDLMNHNVLPRAKELVLPVLMIVGLEDDVTPLSHQEDLFKELSGPKEIFVLENAKHTFRSEDDFFRVKQLLGKWIDRYIS